MDFLVRNGDVTLLHLRVCNPKELSVESIYSVIMAKMSESLQFLELLNDNGQVNMMPVLEYLSFNAHNGQCLQTL